MRTWAVISSQSVMANLLQFLACAGMPTRVRLHLLVLALFPLFVVGNASAATDEEEPVIAYSELCEVCSLQRPFYSLMLFRRGRVTYDGPLLVDTAVPFGAIPLERGRRETQIPVEEVGRWIEMLLGANFFALERSYIGTACAERWDRAIALTINGETHTVRWFWCRQDDFPRVLHEVGEQIEKRVNPRQWIRRLPFEQSPYRPKTSQGREVAEKE